jgi:hypothetical protein
VKEQTWLEPVGFMNKVVMLLQVIQILSALITKQFGGKASHLLMTELY